MLLVGLVLLPEPLGWGFWVMVVSMDETIVVGWRFGPRLTTVDKMVEVMTTGDEFPPPLAEGAGVPLLEALLDA